MKLYGVYEHRSEEKVDFIIKSLQDAGIEATKVYSLLDKIVAVKKEHFDTALEIVSNSIQKM